MVIRNANAFQPDGTFRVTDIFLADGKFVKSSAGETVDADGLFAIPGLVDLHFHGCVGYDFCDGSQEAISAIAKYEASVGVGAICPATMTYPEDKIGQIADAAAAYHTEEDGAELVGINMEGPFIAAAKKGAQNAAYLHAPDAEMFRRLQQRAGGLFKLCDIAPEVEGGLDCIRSLAGEVRVSLAHTASDYDTAKTAFEAGAKQVTHLYNAMQPYSHRAPGLIGAACDFAESVELIADGVHVHPAAVRLTFRAFGDHRIILISDSMMATGMPDGEYSLGGQAVHVSGNLATLADGTIAGSATNLLDCMRTAVRKMGVPLGSAVKAASTNPAKALGLYDRFGSIEPGKTANLLLLDESLEVKSIFLRGKRI